MKILFFCNFQEILAAVNRKEAFQVDHRVINSPSDVNPAINSGSIISSLNKFFY